MEHGAFVISLDFELMWGVRDKKTVASYGKEIKAVHDIVPEMLSLFRTHKVKSTFATVGFLFANSEDDIDQSVPSKKPGYLDKNLSPYEDVLTYKSDQDNPYYFCSQLIELIKNKYPEQELGTHTYSHYYCLEKGQTVNDFEADLEAAIKIAEKKGLSTESIVFPRNQAHPEYVRICQKHGLLSYRGVEDAWYYASQANKEESKLKRAFRLLDTYVNLSGHNTFIPSNENGIVNVKSSRFLRPYSKKLSFLETVKINRIKKAMTHAAKNNEVFHLWWHPHNFGNQTSEMFQQLEDILQHFSSLQKQYSFQSLTMKEVASQILQKN